MPALLLSLLVVVGAVAAALGRPRVSVWVLASMWLLVPGAVRVPGTGTGQLTIHRVIIAAVLLGLLRTVIIGKLPKHVFAMRGTHVAFVGFLAVGLVTGVVLAEARIPSTLNVNPFADSVEQAIFFVTALAVFRAVGARRCATVISVVAGVLAAIAISERLVSWSYTQWFTRSLPDPTGGLLSLDLTTRGTEERVRGAATFALELGWVSAMLIPVTIAAAIGSRRRATVLWAVPAALLWATVWTFSRSAYAGLAIGLVVLVLGVALHQPSRVLPLGVVGLGLGALILQGPLRRTLDLGQTTGEQDVRFQRLPELFDLVSDRPIGGLGLGGLLVRRITVVDLSWVNTYVTLGVVGVVALAALLVTVAHAASRFLLSVPSPTRFVAAGAAAAVVVAPIGLSSYDLLSLRMSTETVWGLAALAIAANEELGVLPVPMRRRAQLVPRPAIALGPIGLAAGFALAASIPSLHTIEATFTTADPRATATAPSDNLHSSRVLSQTACLAIDERTFESTVRCRDLDQVLGGFGEVRVEDRDRDEAGRTYQAVVATVREVFPHTTVAVSGQGSGRPTWASTAPVWMFALAFAGGTLLPDRAYRPVPGEVPRATSRPGAGPTSP